MDDIVKKLKALNQTVSTMESCSGGALASEITNIEGASEIFNFGAVTYATDFKVKMGVNEDLINKYSVYSQEVANDMACAISNFTNSDYGIGITGHLATSNQKNNTVYVGIYKKKVNEYYELKININNENREESKKIIISKIIELLTKIVL